MPEHWLLANQIELLRGLIFTLRDTSSDIDLLISEQAVRSAEHVCVTLALHPLCGSQSAQVVRICSNSTMDITALVTNLASDLTSSTAATRSCAQTLLSIGKGTTPFMLSFPDTKDLCDSVEVKGQTYLRTAFAVQVQPAVACAVPTPSYVSAVNPDWLHSCHIVRIVNRAATA